MTILQTRPNQRINRSTQFLAGTNQETKFEATKMQPKSQLHAQTIPALTAPTMSDNVYYVNRSGP